MASTLTFLSRRIWNCSWKSLMPSATTSFAVRLWMMRRSLTSFKFCNVFSRSARFSSSF